MTEILVRALAATALLATVWFSLLFVKNALILWAETRQARRQQGVDVYRCFICRTEHRIHAEYRDKMHGCRCPECDVELTRISSRSW